MEQYLQALREREDISEEILLELEERFKVVEEEIIDIPIEPTEIELLRIEQAKANAEMIELMISMFYGGGF